MTMKRNDIGQRRLIESNSHCHQRMSSSENVPKMTNKEDPTENQDKPAPKMMKGGLLDRSIISWIRILLVTGTWWAFVAGFLALCFFLMNMVLYGSNDDMPYFVRGDSIKYPGILHQPGININCKNLERSAKGSIECDTTLLSIGINKIFKWTPNIYSNIDNPEMKIHHDKVNMKENLNELGVTTVPGNMVFVTCNGREQVDKDNLKGMKIIGSPGFDADSFPWTGEQSWVEPVTVDVGNSEVARNKSDVKVYIECRAWARNIITEQRFVDKKHPNGGGFAVLCFMNGKIVNIGQGGCT